MVSVFEELGREALKSDYLRELFFNLSRRYANRVFRIPGDHQALEPDEYADLLRFADVLSCAGVPECRNKAYGIISLLYDDYRSDALFQTVAKAVLSKLGNFPSIDYLQARYSEMVKLPFTRELEHAVKEIVQAVPNDETRVFTDAQFELFGRLQDSKVFSFSGPTSMGKSFIIKAFVRRSLIRGLVQNIVIMVPTRALISQFSLDLRKELNPVLGELDYKVVTNSNVSELAQMKQFHYIFVLTPERLISYLAEPKNPEIGLLFVDEAHKIAANDDSRSVTAYSAIEKLLKKYPEANLYFSSPNVRNPEAFLHLFGKWEGGYFKTNESPVAQHLFFVDFVKGNVCQYVDHLPVELPKSLFQTYPDFNTLLHALGETSSNIVYCNSRTNTVERARALYNFVRSRQPEGAQVPSELKKAARQIRGYIHKDYYLASFIELGIAYHYGNLPQIIRNIVEDLYRRELVRNVFCTSTLLEGVNLPGKNIFILSSEKGQTAFSPVDFWNLAGRAGRLGKELSGNIFCVRDDPKCWEKTDFIANAAEVDVVPTIAARIDHNERRIEKILLREEISGTNKEKEILTHVANIICVDTMDSNPEYKSPVIHRLALSNKYELIRLAEQKVKNLVVPTEILSANQTIDLDIQNKAFVVLSLAKESTPITLPIKIDYDNAFAALIALNDLYEWERLEPNLVPTKETLKYLALLMNRWINGSSLNQMIEGAIQFQSNKERDFYVNHAPVGRFNPHDTTHTNELINKLIEDIEKSLRFALEKYFNHYYLLCFHLLGEEKAGVNWAHFLEFGTQNSIVIALQHLGLSRHAASYVYKHHSDCLIIEGGKLTGVSTEKLLERIDPEAIEFGEIEAVLA